MIKKLQEKIKELLREIEHLRRNVRDLQEQLKNSYIRIKNLTEEVQQLRRKIQPEAMFHRQDMPTGWAMPPSENPDAPHIKENNMTKKEKNNG
jgi:predicted transcriptional regulator|tara:strand:- start:221 stop:499 length:279 start_codon:yes stop_codon:yes gene_type:complete